MATKVYIVYYSTFGHVEKLAEEIKKGASSVGGVEAKLWQNAAVKLLTNSGYKDPFHAPSVTKASIVAEASAVEEASIVEDAPAVTKEVTQSSPPKDRIS